MQEIMYFCHSSHEANSSYLLRVPFTGQAAVGDETLPVDAFHDCKVFRIGFDEKSRPVPVFFEEQSVGEGVAGEGSGFKVHAIFLENQDHLIFSCIFVNIKNTQNFRNSLNTLKVTRYIDLDRYRPR